MEKIAGRLIFLNSIYPFSYSPPPFNLLIIIDPLYACLPFLEKSSPPFSQTFYKTYLK